MRLGAPCHALVVSLVYLDHVFVMSLLDPYHVLVMSLGTPCHALVMGLRCAISGICFEPFPSILMHQS